MKGLVVAIFLFMNVLSSAVGEILIPATMDPRLLEISNSCVSTSKGYLLVRFKDSNDEDKTENGSNRPAEIRGTREPPV
jgi:hypothetical protein